MRGELIGSVLVLTAILILFSLLSPVKGQFTSALIDGLRSLFGVGVWIVPFLLGGLGVWLALRDVTEGNTMSPWRLAGALGLFLVFEGFATLIAGTPASAEAAAEGTGGGLLGWAICAGLSTILGLPLTIVVLLILAAFSVMALAGVTLADVSNQLAEFWRGMQNRSRGPEGEKISPRLPLGAEPFLRRWWRTVTARRVQEPARPPLVSSNWYSSPQARAAPLRLHLPCVLCRSRQPHPSRASSVDRPGSCRFWQRSWKTAAIKTSSKMTFASACKPSKARSQVSACQYRS